MLFGAVSFARGMGLRIVKFTAGALKVSPSGFGYALAQIKANIRRPAVYERLLMVGGGAAVLGDVAMRVGWSLRKFVLLGAVASGAVGSLREAMRTMNVAERRITPSADAQRYHDRKHAVFHRMYADQLAYRGLMAK